MPPTDLPTTPSTFTPAEAGRLAGAPWLQRRRTAAAQAFAASPRPTAKDEIWRYSRIDDLDLERFRPAGAEARGGAEWPDGTRRDGSPSDRVHALVARFGTTASLVVTVDGVLATVASVLGEDALTVGRLTDHPDAGELLGAQAGDGDLALLNEAFAPDPLVVDVAPGSSLTDPVVIIHLVTGPAGAACFPRTVVRVGSGATAAAIEVVVDLESDLLAASAGDPGGPPAGGRPPAEVPERLVVPVTELDVGDEATLDFVAVHALNSATWQLAYQASTIGAQATLRSFAVALGGAYARLRTDSALIGPSGTSLLRAAYLGGGDQMLDFRTLQDHRAPRTTSDLLFMGAVADRAHSVYSGMIRVLPGAVKTDALQTNHNLVLDEGAIADSVPNLDIQENDVQCSHGSTVGPVDEDQRYYLETRGVRPEVAEALIIAGFFDTIARQVPVDGARAVAADALARRTRMLVPAVTPLGAGVGAGGGAAGAGTEAAAGAGGPT